MVLMRRSSLVIAMISVPLAPSEIVADLMRRACTSIQSIEPEKVIKKVIFTHPYFNLKNTNLQKDLKLLQGKNRTWFCGSYFGYGFHEDGLKSALEVVKLFDEV